MTYTDELKEVIASFTTNKGEVEVVRLSHTSIDTIYLTAQLEDGTQIRDENGIIRDVYYVPMKLSGESGGSSLLNERTLTIQGINDLIATEEDKIPPDSEERLQVDVLTYIADIDGVLSTVQSGPIRYFLRKTGYSQKNQNATLTVSTTPTNNSETGEIATITKFPTLKGFT